MITHMRSGLSNNRKQKYQTRKKGTSESTCFQRDSLAQNSFHDNYQPESC